MADYSASVTSPWAPERAFDYLAAFHHVQEWDPSMKEAEQLSDGDPLTVGARFRVVAETGPSESELIYETVEIDRPHKVVLVSDTDSFTSTDTITVTPHGEGSEVTYTAEIELKGARKAGEPLLALGLKRMGDEAHEGLAEKVGEDS